MSKCIRLLSIFTLVFFHQSASADNTAEVAKMEAILQKRPEQLRVREKLGAVYFEQKQYKKAIDTLSEYSNEISTDALVTLADAYGLNNDNINKIRMLQLYVEKEPERFRSNFLLGMSYKDAEKYTDAAPYLRKSLQLAPKHRPSYDALLEIFYQSKNNYEARLLVEDMVKTFGKRSEFDNQLCRLYASDGYLEQAQKACQTAIRNDPKFPDNHIYLAQAYYDKKNMTAAGRIFKTAANQFKKSEFVQYAAGQFYLNEKNFPAAVRYLEQAVKLKGDSYRSNLVLAMAMYESRRTEEALPYYEKACRLDKTKDALKEFRVASAKLFNTGKVDLANKYDTAIALCSGP